MHQPIRNLEDLERILGTSRNQLYYLSRKQQYRTKKELKENGSYRTFYIPSKSLMVVQRRILDSIIVPRFRVPVCMYGSCEDKSYVDNARTHLGSKYIVTTDIKNFFPSISHIKIRNVYKEGLCLKESVANLLTRLTTVEGILPQGTPTANILATMVLSNILKNFLKSCEREKLRITIWCDDITISGDNPMRILPRLAEELSRGGLEINEDKTRIFGTGDSPIITGVRLGRHKMYVPDNKMTKYKKIVTENDNSQRVLGIINSIREVNKEQYEYLVNLNKETQSDL